MKFIEFDSEKVVGTAQVEIPLTAKDINTIMVTAIEGGIGYWAVLDNTTPDFKNKPSDTYTSEWVTQLLIDGKTVEFYDVEDEDERWTLDLTKLIKGYAQNFKERPHDNSLEDGDATTSDCIIQYALFNKIVFG